MKKSKYLQYAMDEQRIGDGKRDEGKYVLSYTFCFRQKFFSQKEIELEGRKEMSLFSFFLFFSSLLSLSFLHKGRIALSFL